MNNLKSSPSPFGWLLLNNAEQADLPELNKQMLEGKNAWQVGCQYVDWLLSTYNQDPPDKGTWIKLEFEPIHSKNENRQ